jgi:hypothetical protein
MVILGLLLIIVGAIVVLAAVIGSEGQAELLGFDLSALAIFLLGVAAGAAILWGYGILKWGARRSIAQRRERRELNKRLKHAESERRAESDSQTTQPPAQADTQSPHPDTRPDTGGPTGGPTGGTPRT